VEGRTALLAGLIVELNEVIAKVTTKPPASTTLTGLAGALTKAQKLFESEKADLNLIGSFFPGTKKHPRRNCPVLSGVRYCETCFVVI
jgi:hypothetical protein